MFVFLLLEMGTSVMIKFFDGHNNAHDNLEITIQLFAQSFASKVTLKFFVILKFNYDILTFDVNLTFNLTFL